MNKLQSYKVEYRNKMGILEVVYFRDHPLESAYDRAVSFINRIRVKYKGISLYWKDIHSHYNFGWKLRSFK